jgi:hypothetical protein
LLPKATKFDSSSGRDFFEDLSFLLSNEHRSNEAGNFGFQAIIHHQGEISLEKPGCLALLGSLGFFCASVFSPPCRIFFQNNKKNGFLG